MEGGELWIRASTKEALGAVGSRAVGGIPWKMWGGNKEQQKGTSTCQHRLAEVIPRRLQPCSPVVE